MARETEIDLRIKSNIDKVNKDIEKTTDNVEQLGKATEGVNENFDAFEKKLEKSLDKAEEGVEKVTGAVDKVKGVGREVTQNLGAIEEGLALVGVESDALATSIEAVDTAMEFTDGVQGLAEAGKGFLDFGKMGLKALNAVKAGLVSTGIGAIIVGIGVAVGLLIANFDQLRDMMKGVSDDQKALNDTLDDYKKGAKEAIVQTKKVNTAFNLAKKGVISKEEALDTYNETLGDAFGKAKNLAEAEELYNKKADAYVEAMAKRERANALFAKSAELTAQSATAEFEDNRSFMQKWGTSLLKSYGFVSKANELATEQQIKATEEIKKASAEQAEAVQKLAEAELKGAEETEEANEIKSDAEQKYAEEAKERRKKLAENNRQFQRDLFDEQMNSIKESYEKERQLLIEDYRRQREDIMLNEDLTAKQKKELIEANKKSQDFAIQQLEKEHQEALTEIDSQAEELRISLMKNSFEQRKAEIDKEYQDQLAEVEANEIMTEEQKTTIRLLYAEQRNQQLNELQAEQNVKELENQITLNQAKQLQSEADFEANMELRKQQLELERDLELQEADLTAEQKLLIEEQYQKALRELDDETKEHDKKNILAKVDLAQQGFAMLSELIDTFSKEDEESQRKAFKLNKAINLAQAVTNTALAVTGALSEPSLIPGERFIKAGIAGALGLAQIVKISKTKFDSPTADTGGGATSGAGAGGGDVISPNFNVVGDSGVNPLEGLDQPPLQAYVVSGNVTSAQSLDRNRIENATI